MDERTGAVPDLDAVPALRELADEPGWGPASAASAPPRPGVGHLTRTEAAARPDLFAAELDWGQVGELRRRASELITAESTAQQRSGGRALQGDDRLLLGRALIRRVVGDHVRALHRAGAELWSPAQEQNYVTAVEDAVFGYGRLQPLLEMGEVENIEIHGWDSVVVQYGDGRRERMPPVADSDDELVEAIRFLGQNGQPSRPFDDTHPSMTLALGERFRLHAIGFGLSYRPSVVIRQHTLTDVSLAELADGGLMPLEVARFLDAAILARKSVVISGDQGAGKTTLLRALVHAIPADERFGTLETDYELMTHRQPGRENILALQARTGHGETSGGTRVGEVTIADLMPEALRQNLSRLVVGEVRGGEAAAMFEAMQAGTGTLSTTHSHSAESTIDRLASRVAQGGVLTIDEAYRQIAHNIHLLVHVRLQDDTWKGGVRRRFLSEIRQVTRATENGRPVTHLTYSATGTGPQPPGFFPDADFEAELLAFRRPLPRRRAAEGRR
ncbi:Type IV secretory pathway ATPase VirB11/Archaellum biosynthesis ATPase [Friedmanniella luteola]|uniref:Type IV secretory pathway ATPase VirB11/Archaellum biosynthesis ATPase n=1 Tax=Friedmanniella luteola TaxID=546871 RepID=A0A1H2A6K0_9ACTN|nr:CpaF/VirB11 family protein [Friedmanniella luteola]SDT41507.1 Type IV secretory pathway ATPase VirB11/Archaellum biosynthesis ATPase [Friedmanniella luteola]